MSDNFVFLCSVVIGIAFLAMFVVIRKKEGYTKILALWVALLFFFLAASVHFYERFHDSSWWIPVGDLCILVIFLYGFWIFISMEAENNQKKYKVGSESENGDFAKEKLDISDEKLKNISLSGINPTRES